MKHYVVRKSRSGYWLSYFLEDWRARPIYRIMGIHDSMRSAIEGIYE